MLFLLQISWLRILKEEMVLYNLVTFLQDTIPETVYADNFRDNNDCAYVRMTGTTPTPIPPARKNSIEYTFVIGSRAKGITLAYKMSILLYRKMIENFSFILPEETVAGEVSPAILVVLAQAISTPMLSGKEENKFSEYIFSIKIIT